MLGSVLQEGNGFQITLLPGVEPDVLFNELAGRVSVRSFVVNEPSLHTIFVNLVHGKEN